MSSCEHYQELISRMIDGELSAREEADLRTHLAECPECAALFSAFSAVSRGIGKNLEDAPYGLRENVMARIRREEIRKKNRLPAVLRGVLSAAACAAIVFGVYMGVNLSRNTQSAPLAAAAYDSSTAEQKIMAVEEAVPEEAVELEEAAELPAEEPAAGYARTTEAAPEAAADAEPEMQLNALPREAEAEEPMAKADSTAENATEEMEAEWDLSDWDLSLLRDLLGGKPVERSREELADALLGHILVRSGDTVLSVPIYGEQGVLYYYDPLHEAVFQAELSPDALLDFLIG